MVFNFFSSQSSSLKAQGAVEYLLLIAGVVLVGTVVLLLLFTSVIPAGNQFLQNNLNNAIPNLPPFGGGSPLSPYSGPLLMDWSLVPAANYLSFGIDNFSDPPQLLFSNKIISNVKLTNTSPTTPITVSEITPFFTFTSVQTSPLPTLVSITAVDSLTATVIQVNSVASAQTIAFPSSIALAPLETWTFTFTFDEAVFPLYQSYYYYPAESNHSLRLEFVEPAAPANIVHRPNALKQFLVYEKGLSTPAGFSSATLAGYVNVCDGSLVPDPFGFVGKHDDVVGVVTDWCVPAALPAACDYQRDVGYSTIFSFPTTLPAAATHFESQLFFSQIGFVESGGGAFDDSDSYIVVKNSASCPSTIFDNVPDVGNTPGMFLPMIGMDDLAGVKALSLGSLIASSENALVLTLVGNLVTPPYPTGIVTEGFRQWKTGFSTGEKTPTPFLVVRYEEPI